MRDVQPLLADQRQAVFGHQLLGLHQSVFVEPGQVAVHRVHTRDDPARHPHEQRVLSPALPAIDTTAFPGTPYLPYWSSSLVAGTSSSAWYVPFYSGSTAIAPVTNANLVRCVR